MARVWWQGRSLKRASSNQRTAVWPLFGRRLTSSVQRDESLSRYSIGNLETVSMLGVTRATHFCRSAHCGPWPPQETGSHRILVMGLNWGLFRMQVD